MKCIHGNENTAHSKCMLCMVNQMAAPDYPPGTAPIGTAKIYSDGSAVLPFARGSGGLGNVDPEGTIPLKRDRTRTALEHAKQKLQLYREAHSGEYVGGVEYTRLIAEIDEALATPKPFKFAGDTGGLGNPEHGPEAIIPLKRKTLEVGKIVEHPEHGKVLIIAGSFMGAYGRISNFWRWRKVDSDGNATGDIMSGYGAEF